MALKDLFTMAKADRYTQDGRDQLIKAQEVETEDRRYKNGEISEKTGLMKTPKGWVEPPKGGKTPKGNNSGMSKHWVQKGDKADFVERTPQEEKAMWGKVAARQSDDKLKLAIKNREGKELNPVEKIKLETAKEELAKREGSKSDTSLNKSWSQSDVINELPKGWKRVEGATTAPNGYVVVSNNQSRFGGDRETKLIKQEDFNKGNTQTFHEKIPAIRKEEDSVSVKEADDFYKGHGFNKTGEKVNNVDETVTKEYKDAEGNTIYSKFNKEGRHYGSDFEPGSTEKKPAAPKPTYISQMSQEKQDKVKNALTNYFKNDIGLSGSDLEDAVNNGLDSKISDLRDIESDEVKKALSEDSAPRVLTGDCKIRIRK